MEEKNGGETEIMVNKIKDKVKKKKVTPTPIMPEFSQMQLRGRERIRRGRLMTPMLARVKRKETMEEFFKKKKKHEKA